MSDKIKIIAAACVIADANGITLASNVGFDSATRDAVGAYTLKTKHKHGKAKFVVGLTRSGTAAGSMQAVIPGALDEKVDTIQLSNIENGVAADTAFFISVMHVDD